MSMTEEQRISPSVGNSSFSDGSGARVASRAGVRGFFGIGIEGAKKEHNLGTLWRSAANLGAGFIFTVGARYRHQCSDTVKAWRHIPLFQFDTVEEFYDIGLPYDCRLVGIELVPGAFILPEYRHHERAVYLLGAEDRGLSSTAMARCHEVVEIPSTHCLNVSVAGAIVMYDRASKTAGAHP